MNHSDIVFTENCDPFVLKIVQAMDRQRKRMWWWRLLDFLFGRTY